MAILNSLREARLLEEARLPARRSRVVELTSPSLFDPSYGIVITHAKRTMEGRGGERVKEGRERGGLMSATGVFLPTFCPQQSTKRPRGFVSSETCQFNTKSRCRRTESDIGSEKAKGKGIILRDFYTHP